MVFLTVEQLQGQLKEAQIIEISKILNNSQIEQIEKLIEVKLAEEFGKGQCLFNAYQIAKITNANIIEGIARVQVEKDNDLHETIIKHAWNILNGIQFDITKDLVWPNLSVALKKIEYFTAKEFSKGEYNISNASLEFKSEVDLMATSLRFQRTKQIILADLNYWGLDKTFHEQLLNDCINSIK